VTDSSKAMDLI